MQRIRARAVASLDSWLWADEQPLSGVYFSIHNKIVWQALCMYTYSIPPSCKGAIPHWAKANKGQDAILLSSSKYVYMHAKHAGSDDGSAKKNSQCQKQKAQTHNVTYCLSQTPHSIA